jgi:hypothetical protein
VSEIQTKTERNVQEIMSKECNFKKRKSEEEMLKKNIYKQGIHSEKVCLKSDKQEKTKKLRRKKISDGEIRLERNGIEKK